MYHTLANAHRAADGCVCTSLPESLQVPQCCLIESKVCGGGEQIRARDDGRKERGGLHSSLTCFTCCMGCLRRQVLSVTPWLQYPPSHIFFTSRRYTVGSQRNRALVRHRQAIHPPTDLPSLCVKRQCVFQMLHRNNSLRWCYTVRSQGWSVCFIFRRDVSSSSSFQQNKYVNSDNY